MGPFLKTISLSLLFTTLTLVSSFNCYSEDKSNSLVLVDTGMGIHIQLLSSNGSLISFDQALKSSNQVDLHMNPVGIVSLGSSRSPMRDPSLQVKNDKVFFSDFGIDSVRREKFSIDSFAFARKTGKTIDLPNGFVAQEIVLEEGILFKRNYRPIGGYYTSKNVINTIPVGRNRLRERQVTAIRAELKGNYWAKQLIAHCFVLRI